MPGLCDPETELPLSTWRVTLVVAPISLPRPPDRACPPGGRADPPRGFGRCAASAAQRGWSARTSVRCTPRSGCGPRAVRVVASAGPQLPSGCAVVKTWATSTLILDQRLNRVGRRPTSGSGERKPSRPPCAAALGGWSASGLQLRRSRVVWGPIGAVAVLSGGVSPSGACFGGGHRLRACPGGPTGRRFAPGSGSIWYASPREDRAR
jgi:hypothetical protein